jgi:hypothetical protein
MNYYYGPKSLVLTLLLLNIIYLMYSLIRYKTQKTLERREQAEGTSGSTAPFERALAELETNRYVPELWAKAYALTKDEESRKKFYVKERAKLLSSKAQPELRNLRKFGWVAVGGFVVTGAVLFLGFLTIVGEAGSYAQFLSTVDGRLSIAGLLIMQYLIFFNMNHKRITGYRFGKWPMEPKLRPRFFFGIWVGMFSFHLILTAIEAGFYLGGGAHGTPRDHLDGAIINLLSFLFYVLIGLVIAFFYKIKVR